jgi:hypothetical protein
VLLQGADDGAAVDKNPGDSTSAASTADAAAASAAVDTDLPAKLESVRWRSVCKRVSPVVPVV